MSIGVDIVQNIRFQSFLNDQKKIDKILSTEEKEIFNSFSSEKRKLEYIASRFSAKEALFKATNEKVAMNQISILNDKNGKPYVKNKKDIEISISHETDYSITFVIKH